MDHFMVLSEDHFEQTIDPTPSVGAPRGPTKDQLKGLSGVLSELYRMAHQWCHQSRWPRPITDLRLKLNLMLPCSIRSFQRKYWVQANLELFMEVYFVN